VIGALDPSFLGGNEYLTAEGKVKESHLRGTREKKEKMEKATDEQTNSTRMGRKIGNLTNKSNRAEAFEGRGQSES